MSSLGLHIAFKNSFAINRIRLPDGVYHSIPNSTHPNQRDTATLGKHSACLMENRVSFVQVLKSTD